MPQTQTLLVIYLVDISLPACASSVTRVGADPLAPGHLVACVFTVGRWKSAGTLGRTVTPESTALSVSREHLEGLGQRAASPVPLPFLCAEVAAVVS